MQYVHTIRISHYPFTIRINSPPCPLPCHSVLVAKAAQYDISALAACFLVILIGLSSTLLIVSVFRSAIPALPVSIGLGVLAYLFTR
jgi:hypothetical protein